MLMNGVGLIGLGPVHMRSDSRDNPRFFVIVYEKPFPVTSYPGSFTTGWGKMAAKFKMAGASGPGGAWPKTYNKYIVDFLSWTIYVFIIWHKLLPVKSRALIG